MPERLEGGGDDVVRLSPRRYDLGWKQPDYVGNKSFDDLLIIFI